MSRASLAAAVGAALPLLPLPLLQLFRRGARRLGGKLRAALRSALDPPSFHKGLLLPPPLLLLLQ